MMKLPKKIEDLDRAVSGSTAELARATGILSRIRRISWKEALAEIASPAIRLHRYRNAHNRMLVDALCKMDCPGTGTRNL